MVDAETIVNRLLETWDISKPPKLSFDEPEEEIDFHAKSPFTAYSHALDRGQHHPRLWAAVRGSVYEPLYRKRFNMTEGKRGPSMKTLKQHRRQLDDDERKMVMRRRAVWHNGPGGKTVPGVWKSVVNGKPWYVCCTHRAAAVKSTLKQAIKAFDFIKTTS